MRGFLSFNLWKTTWPLLLALLLLWPAPGGNEVQARERHVPGNFDYYVLALSWSPTYCLQEGRKRRDAQCRPGSGHGFVLHGLWPQYRRGWPSRCRTDARFVPDQVIREVLDVMPSKGLVIHQWRKHGTCSGLSPRAFFAFSEKLFRSVVIPPAYQRPAKPLLRTPEQIARDFAEANRARGFVRDSFTVICTRERRDAALLREVRVCFTPTGRPSRCGANEQRARCRARMVQIPPVR